MQIAFWSNMHGQGATTANTVASSCVIAHKSSYKMLIAQNHIEKNALEGYFIRKRDHAAIRFLDQTNQGIDALVRLCRNGRLKPEMVPDYAYSLMKNHGLDVLFAGVKKEVLSSDAEDVLLNIFQCAMESYDLVMLDLHSGLETNSRFLLESSDVIVFCLAQNRNMIDDFKRVMEANPALPLKRCAFVISRFDADSHMSLKNIARDLGIDSKAIFAIPYHVGFLNACNSGKVIDFFSYCLQSKKGPDYEFARAFSLLTDYILKGCAEPS
jgi:hypothetical protein